MTAAQASDAAPAKSSDSSPAKDSGLTFHGITFYGTVDLGVAYLNHGAPLSAYYGPGLPFLIQKNSYKSIFSIAPNGLSQSKLGVSGVEPVAKDLSVVFRLETGFQPTSGNLTDGPRSLIVASGKPQSQQPTYGDSSRAGQPFQGAAYIGIQSKPYGTLIFGRQTALVVDNLLKYDPQAQSQAFSPIGYSGVAGGAGDTEDARLDNTIKYTLQHGPFRLALLHQFKNGSDLPGGADQIDIGADVAGLSLDASYDEVKDAISLAPLTAAQVAVHPDTLSATISDNRTYNLNAKYVAGPVKYYAGYEHITFGNPSDPIAAGATDIGGYVLGYVNNTAYAHHKVLQVSWVGVRYSVSKSLDVTGAYYRYAQNSYKGNGCGDTSSSACSGSMNAASVVADYKLSKRFDVYAGVNYSSVQNGLASGYLESATVAPMAGMRFNF